MGLKVETGNIPVILPVLFYGYLGIWLFKIFPLKLPKAFLITLVTGFYLIKYHYSKEANRKKAIWLVIDNKSLLSMFKTSNNLLL